MSEAIFQIIDMLAVTAELCGTTLKENALAVMAKDLERYPLPAIEAALAKVRMSGRFTLSAVAEAIAEQDGRPGADEAWAIAVNASDESATVVWTEEIAEAFAAAKPVLDVGDKIGARMAFRAAYERIVEEARKAAAPTVWKVSLGFDSTKRVEALTRAVERKRLPATSLQHCLPPSAEGIAIGGLLTGTVVETNSAGINARLRELRNVMQAAIRRAETERIEKAEAQSAENRARKRAAIEALDAWTKRKEIA